MNKTSTFVILVLFIATAILGWMLWVKPAEAPSVPNDTTTTLGTDNSTDSGSTITAPVPLHERVNVIYPAKNATVPKKFTVTGKAPGNWFFEASAPVIVIDKEGNKLAQTTAQTLSDWMTTELVPFEAKIEISSTYSGPATLVLLKDNPSGLPENEDSLEIPVNVQ